MLNNQNFSSDYFQIWNNFRYHKNREILIKELQGIFPFDNRVFRKHSWDIAETTLIYYELDSKTIFSVLDIYAIQSLLQVIDSESIQELLLNHQGHKVSPAQNYVLVSNFISFLQEKSVPIPKHLGTNIVKGQSQENKSDSDDCNLEIRKTKKRVYDPLILRKEAIINKAKIEWFKELKDVEDGKRKSYTKPSELARRKELLEYAIEINITLSLPPLKIKNDTHALKDYEKLKNNPIKLKEYFNNLKSNPDFLIDSDWISPYFPGKKILSFKDYASS